MQDRFFGARLRQYQKYLAPQSWPKDGPGVFFVKLPQEWMNHQGWQRATVQGARDFFAEGTGRISSVVFYLEPIELLDFVAEDGRHYVAQQGHYFREEANPKRRYGKDLDWKLFESRSCLKLAISSHRVGVSACTLSLSISVPSAGEFSARKVRQE
jgi:hypothetical protein